MSFHDVLKRGDEELLSTRPERSLLWNFASQLTCTSMIAICKVILATLYNVEVKGLDNFDRGMAKARSQNRGFLTVMNHMSTCDDPMFVACLPWRYSLEWNNIRWGLAASNVCFTNKTATKFFSLGKIIPCERFGRGPFQSGLDACVRILSPDDTIDANHMIGDSTNIGKHALSLFSKEYISPLLRYQTSWVHIFPEGYVCQLRPPHSNSMRFFRWGAARLILEPTVAPVVVPIFADGFELIKPEELDLKTDYLTPNNVGAQVTMNIGRAIDDDIIGSFRKEWQLLCAKYPNPANPNDLSDELMYGAEARDLRNRVCSYLRGECAQLRLQNGFPDEDPRFQSVDFWTRYTKSRGASDPDVRFVGLNWAIKEYQHDVKVYDERGNVIGKRDSERPKNV